VSQFTDRDDAWAQVARGVLAAVTQPLLRERSVPRNLVQLSPAETGTTLPLPRDNIKAFIVASPSDEALVMEFVQHLSVLATARKVVFTTTRTYPLGQALDQLGHWVRSQMSAADAVMLLLSPNILADEQLGINVLRHAASLRSNGRTQVWLVLARPVYFHAPDLALPVLPAEGDFVTTRADRDAAWTEVARSIVRDLSLDLESDRSFERPTTEREGRLAHERESTDAVLRVLVIHAPEDFDSLREFEKHAASLVRTGRFEIQRRSTDEEGASATPLERANIVVVLASANLFASYDDLLADEIERGVVRLREGLQKLVLVRLRPCHVYGPLESVPALPNDRAWVHSLPDRDLAWVRVWAGICEMCGVKFSS
jgi:hypothetical protein